ncbi:MAG: hypothetical protein ACP5OG_05420 [Candidatus Nanoarchaeia archaeon]
MKHKKSNFRLDSLVSIASNDLILYYASSHLNDCAGCSGDKRHDDREDKINCTCVSDTDTTCFCYGNESCECQPAEGCSHCPGVYASCDPNYTGCCSLYICNYDTTKCYEGRCLNY